MTEPTNHYFTDSPAAADAERRQLHTHLAGRDVTVETAGGIFSPGGLDKATAILLDEVPDPPSSGDLLDLGCGWGPIALTLAMRSPEATVWAVDVTERALDLTRRNAQALGLDNVRAVRPDEVPSSTPFAAIWSNPPIRIGKPAVHELMRTWLPRLAKGADAHLVVGKNLGADSLQRWITNELGLPTERTASSKGFRVLRVSRPV
ncbi:methyltransferase [Janibacter cremeus]|uniref:class I SAM-dependent methyltransferase n=1 Tax=Janibacter cremeus TaxID=1285192 RepID=UPI0023F7A295|nr:methyltransferase [Janibacter cremeus]WEV79420.1 methyltransferase [Janibacter cremeus]